MKLRACKHLDYDETKYTSCQLIDNPIIGVKFWRRKKEAENNTENPINIQFCKLHGRINLVIDCYEPGFMDCYEPIEEGEEK